MTVWDGLLQLMGYGVLILLVACLFSSFARSAVRLLGALVLVVFGMRGHDRW